MNEVLSHFCVTLGKPLSHIGFLSVFWNVN